MHTPPWPERDLSFADVVNPRPQALTPQQVEHFNRHGYVTPLNLFTPAEARANRDYFDDLMERVKQARPGSDSYAINGYHRCCRGLWELVQHPKILDYVQDLVGPDIICWGTHYFCKMPRDPKAVSWHQDASYWPLTPARTVTVWLAIDDADEGNAAMRFIPGTHRMGALKWGKPKGPAVLWQEIEGVEQLGEPVVNTLRAGQMSLHADMLAHGSHPNPSDRRRCGLTIRYCPPSVRAIEPSWATWSILCRGEDRSGHWGNLPCPSGENVPALEQERAIGAN